MISKLLLGSAWKKWGAMTKIPFKLTFSDGEVYRNIKSEPKFTVHYKTAGSQWRTIFMGYTGMFDSYVNQTVDIKGSFESMVLAGDDVAKETKGYNLQSPLVKIALWWHEFTHDNRSIEQAVENAKFHYNLGTDMFRMQLDPTMTYTCAYWKEGTKNLEEAQRNKIEHVCRKLQLKKGETLIDIGGGWGSVLMHAAEKYGVTGVNVSPTPDQNRALKEELKKRGLEDKIKIQEVDFRQAKGTYDKYVSLGVYEHAGRSQLKNWIKCMSDNLKPGGIGVLHWISGTDGNFNYWTHKHIFPGACVPSLSETVKLMEDERLEVQEVENLRRHYAPTLGAWADNFEKNWDKIHALDPEKFDESFRRKWKIYLRTVSASFICENRGGIGLMQIVFTKGWTDKDYPMTREHLYKSKE